MMSTCFWSPFESGPWNPLPVTTDGQADHVSRKIAGRRESVPYYENSRDSRRPYQNIERSQINPRRQQQQSDYVLDRSNGTEAIRFNGTEATRFNGTEATRFNGRPPVSAMRPNSQQGDGRWNNNNNRPARGIVGGMSRMSFETNQGNKELALFDNCREELKKIEKFRLEKETELNTLYPGKKVTSNSNPVARPAIEHSPIAVLVEDHFKEQAKVSTLVSTMDVYHPVHLGVYSAIQSWRNSIVDLQTVNKQQMFPGAGDRSHLVQGDQKSLALEKLCSKTRAARTAFWSAYIGFITEEWKGGCNPPRVIPVPEPSPLPPRAPLVTKTGRPLIPFLLPGLPSS